MLWILFNIMFFMMVTSSLAQYTYAFGTYTRHIEGLEIRRIAIEGRYIWCSSWHDEDRWVIRYDKQSGQIVRYPSEECVVSFDGVNFGAYNYNLGGGTREFTDSKNTVWLVSFGGIKRFNGTGWEEIDYPSPWCYYSVGEDRQGVLWFGADDGVKSFNGTNWVIYDYENANVPIIYAHAITFDKNNVKWFGTVGGIWSFDGKTWKWYNGGEYVEGNEYYPAISDIEIDSDGVIWIAACYEGLMTFSPDTGTGVKQSHKPEKIQIINVSPNPFNASPTITFTIPTLGHTTLAIYSATGQKIRTLLSGPLATGKHSVTWNGRDDGGRPVSSGVYFARLESGGNAAVAKMLFVK